MSDDGSARLAALEAKLAGLAGQVRRELPERARELRAALDGLERDEDAGRAAIQRLAHKLRGTVGSHGIEGLTEPAAAVEGGARSWDAATLRRAVLALADRVEAAGRTEAPAARAPVERPAPSAPIARPLDGRSAIAIDDDEPTRRLLGMTLSNLGGARASIESSSESFFAALGKGAFDFVIVDAMMPEMNGLDCLRRIVDGGLSRADTTYIVLSAATREELAWELPAGLTVVWMRKPFRPRELLDALVRARSGG